ncbi:MFS transporter [Pseudemcibacter aquimaris]|uniref:MFS transporter n=1 Tax=Pseudemcibacter aquimaris TaxID=2857064 RepID=UPI0020122B64|nr:MFS transporter [Pseudemcibacter aquimaris]MCC3859849.1 MFS transporter [Pseudemcibacter aquimaris]WDU57181.1 MFS transporter [Pseudemcibacter aquimaris]
MSDIQLERKVVWLAALIQLANVLDFMIILPLGPDLTTSIGIPSSRMGLLGGIYTFAAAISAIVMAPYLDRFDRKRAVLFFLAGLAVSTYLCSFAYDTYSMLAARTLAGIFGGPVTALSLSMVVDVVPISRRARSIAIVSSAFTVSSVFGIPFALKLAGLMDWTMPFIVIGIFSGIVCIAIYFLLPSMTGHIDENTDKTKKVPILPMVKKPIIRTSYIMASLQSFAQFMLFAGSINYFIFNLGFDREGLDEIYFVGGSLSFIAMMLTGRIVDKYGSRLLSFIITVFYVCVLADGYLHQPFMSVPFIFCSFMLCAAMIGVVTSSIASEAPDEQERAAYMSVQSTCRHLAAGAGGIVATAILSTNPDGSLNNIHILAYLTILCIASLPVLIFMLRNMLDRKSLA